MPGFLNLCEEIVYYFALQATTSCLGVMGRTITNTQLHVIPVACEVSGESLEILWGASREPLHCCNTTNILGWSYHYSQKILETPPHCYIQSTHMSNIVIAILIRRRQKVHRAQRT